MNTECSTTQQCNWGHGTNSKHYFFCTPEGVWGPPWASHALLQWHTEEDQATPQHFQLKHNLLLANCVALENSDWDTRRTAQWCAVNRLCLQMHCHSAPGDHSPAYEQMWADEKWLLRGNLRSSSINIRQLTLPVMFFCCPFSCF